MKHKILTSILLSVSLGAFMPLNTVFASDKHLASEYNQSRTGHFDKVKGGSHHRRGGHHFRNNHRSSEHHHRNGRHQRDNFFHGDRHHLGNRHFRGHGHHHRHHAGSVFLIDGLLHW